jgi:hypothetical protein
VAHGSGQRPAAAAPSLAVIAAICIRQRIAAGGGRGCGVKRRLKRRRRQAPADRGPLLLARSVWVGWLARCVWLAKFARMARNRLTSRVTFMFTVVTFTALWTSVAAAEAVAAEAAACGSVCCHGGIQVSQVGFLGGQLAHQNLSQLPSSICLQGCWFWGDQLQIQILLGAGG